MSGQAGNRGYLVQTLIAVVDSLDLDSEWVTLTVEPDAGSEKVDIAWGYADRRRVVQVKSSENAITVPAVRKWARELESSIVADEYELRLIGLISVGLRDIAQCGKVQIPTPQPLNLEALIHQAAHRIDGYLEQRQFDPIRSTAREILVNALVSKLSTFATRGDPMSRAAFDKLIQSWVNEIRVRIPEGLKHTGQSNTPHQIPPPPADFTGRQAELLELRSVITGCNPAVVAIRGLGGIGKTSFALMLIKELVPEYEDGQILVDLRGTSDKPLTAPQTMEHVIRSIRADFGKPISQGEIEPAYRTALHAKRILVLFENAASREQLEPLIPGSPSLIIYTSRQQFGIPGQVQTELPTMNPLEATRLVTTIAPRATEIADALAQLCGYLPLAIRVSARTLSERPDIAVVDYLVLQRYVRHIS